MADNRIVLYNFSLKPGHSIGVKGFIPEGCKGFAINLGKDNKNFVLYFNPRLDHVDGDKNRLVLNSLEDGVWGAEQRESFFPFHEGSDTMACFKFEQDKITIQLPCRDPFSFQVRFPIEEISYLSLISLQLKSITLK
ncbi:unnamed protein product [Staurois parvus]|uniref:Galectin n=1 Tax=Staurois parvus TaxID=386267 RepID=A0ABN9GJQ9_9NEOB|nr:unnamed protein product [Staurois parvus]